MILVKCNGCRSDIGYVSEGARYELKCPKGCRVWTRGIAPTCAAVVQSA